MIDKEKFIEYVDMMHRQNLNGREDFIEAFQMGIEAAYEESLPCVISSLPEYDVEEINEIVQQLKDGKISLFEAIGNTWNKGYFVGAGDKFISSC